MEEALESALDQLGIDERDAEVEVLEEPKTGLFGRLRSEARIRARVRPTRPRPKPDRQDRSRRRSTRTAKEPKQSGSTEPGYKEPRAKEPATSRRPEPRAQKRSRPTVESAPRGQGDEAVTEKEVPLQEQAEIAREFLDGLLDELSLPASVDVQEVDAETVELAVNGTDLGLLIGPKGSTLSALQDVTRTVVNRRTGARNGRILVDVAGYRQKRKEALERFTQEVAAGVKESGAARALEAMNPADRKVVHDTVNAMEGVSTTSEGEEPSRRVIIQPD